MMDERKGLVELGWFGEMPPSNALTREQVDKAFLGLYQEQHIKGNVGVTTTLNGN